MWAYTALLSVVNTKRMFTQKHIHDSACKISCMLISNLHSLEVGGSETAMDFMTYPSCSLQLWVHMYICYKVFGLWFRLEFIYRAIKTFSGLFKTHLRSCCNSACVFPEQNQKHTYYVYSSNQKACYLGNTWGQITFCSRRNPKYVYIIYIYLYNTYGLCCIVCRRCAHFHNTQE